jgi:hypothetical protein
MDEGAAEARLAEARLAAGLAEVLTGSADAVSPARQAAVLRAAADALEAAGRPAACRIVPFVPGRRPTDEETHPGLGSSDEAAFVTGPHTNDNRAIVLFEVEGVQTVDATVTLERSGSVVWDTRPVPLHPTRRRQAVVIEPERDLAASDLGFGVGFLERARVDIRGLHGDVPIAADTAWLDVCDVRLLGSLYARVLHRVVAPDAARQAKAAGVPNPGAAYHPWYPVLTIGADKAALYTSALVGDVVGKEDHLTDPAWLLRVGVYLELLTCIGIFEAVRDDEGLGDLLDPAERRAYETSDVYAEVRTRVDVEAWREVWDMRRIVFASRGTPRTGPVSARNLLQKKRTTLRFLHVHHEDLKHAIALAGPNRHNAQETWHRVFRDAERAVLRQTAETFPELGFLPSGVRDLVLWQRLGFAEQHGLYPTACNQYRASMNAVADWAKSRDLMDYTGPECVPARVSLLEAHMSDPAQVAVLQRSDGYGPRLDVAEPLTTEVPTVDEVEAMLAAVPILKMLGPDDVRALAMTARPVLLGPGARLVVQGEEGTSLFLVADGVVEVLVRQGNGADVAVDTMGPGQVVGEMSLLTGEPRGATVRAVDGAVVYEIGAESYRPLVQANPHWVDELAAVMEDRLARRQVVLAERGGSLRARIRRRFLG